MLTRMSYVVVPRIRNEKEKENRFDCYWSWSWHVWAMKWFLGYEMKKLREEEKRFESYWRILFSRDVPLGLFAWSLPLSPQPCPGLQTGCLQAVWFSVQSHHGHHVGTDSSQHSALPGRHFNLHHGNRKLPWTLLCSQAYYGVDLGRQHAHWSILRSTLQVINYSTIEQHIYKVTPLFRFVRVANARKDPGPDGLKIFNIGYLAGLAGLLLAWNSTMLIKVIVSDEYIIGFTALCTEQKSESKPFYPITIAIAILSLCIFFSLLITKRTYRYLNKLPDSQLRFLPAKNALTYIDTLILFFVVSGTYILKSLYSLFWTLDFLSFDTANLFSCITSIIVDDIGLGFIFPIYIIIKTKRYLPKL